MAIDRRTFLGATLGAGALGAMPGMSRHLSATPRTTSTTIPARQAGTGERVLVLVTLYGGNDGLSTLVPFEDPAYYQQRGAWTAVPAVPSVLSIGNGLGWHPALSGINALWQAGNVAIVRGVGYPNPDYSHFASMDIWQSADPNNELGTGWLGRWLDGTTGDALQSIYLGSNVPLAFVGKNRQASSIIANNQASAELPPADSVLLAAYSMLESPNHQRDELESQSTQQARAMLSVSNAVAQVLTHVAPPTKYLPASAGALGTQLSVVSQLIAGGFPTKVYGVSMGGFDSHAGEQSSYANLYAQLDRAVSGFFKSLAPSAAANTVMLIYTEFGRRVGANASGGTDHGAGNDAFVIGPAVKGGLYGSEPSLTALDDNGSLVVGVDFRSIYATLLDQVIDVEPTAVLRSSWAEIPFI